MARYADVALSRTYGHSLDNDANTAISRTTLALQGFVTAIANPKGWAFFVTLLPPFLDASRPMTMQIISLVIVLLAVEFACLIIYASGGRSMRHFLEKAVMSVS